MSDKRTSTTHVIFDLGQTIIDGIDNFNYVLQKYARRKGKQWTGEVSREVESGVEVFKNFLIDIDDETYKYPDQFQNFMRQVFNDSSELGFKMMPGALKLVTHLHSHTIPMAFASNADQKELNLAIERTLDLEPTLFSHSVAGGDDPEVKNNKPAPDIYLVCAKRFKTPPKTLDSCVIFEDSIRGITGAVQTGMKTVFINNTDVDRIDDIKDKITVIVDSLENFKPESVGLPPY